MAARKAIRVRVELDAGARVILNADALCATEDDGMRRFAAGQEAPQLAVVAAKA
jgi:nicotinamidase-related amidase